MQGSKKILLAGFLCVFAGTLGAQSVQLRSFAEAPNNNQLISLTALKPVSDPDIGDVLMPISPANNATDVPLGIQAAPVPEPTTVAMTIFGVGLLVGAQRFRRSRR